MSVEYIETNKTINIYKCTDGISGDEYILKAAHYSTVEYILKRKKINFEKLVIEEHRIKNNRKVTNVYFYNRAIYLEKFREKHYNFTTIIKTIKNSHAEHDTYKMDYEIRSMNEREDTVIKIYFKESTDAKAIERVKEILKKYDWESVLLLNYSSSKLRLVLNEEKD